VPEGARLLTSGAADQDMSWITSLSTGEWRIIEPLETRMPHTGKTLAVSSVEWLIPEEELLIRHEADGVAAREQAYRFVAEGGWVDQWRRKIPYSGPSAAGISVGIQQGENQPPEIVASADKRELTLTKPTALEGVWRSRVHSFQWQDADRSKLTGGLMLPRDYSEGKRVPLVIQAYYYFPEVFLPDGPHRPRTPPRRWIARGMAVLQSRLPCTRIDLHRQTRVRFVRRIGTAIDALTKAGSHRPSSM